MEIRDIYFSSITVTMNKAFLVLAFFGIFSGRGQAIDSDCTPYSGTKQSTKDDLLADINDSLGRQWNHNVQSHTFMHLELHLANIDESKNRLSIHGFVQMNWTDTRFVWDVRNYSCINNVPLDGSRYVWRPSLTLEYRSGDYMETLGRERDYPIVAYNNGFMSWLTSLQGSTSCRLELTYWPYDSQQCSLEFSMYHLGPNSSLSISNSTRFGELPVVREKNFLSLIANEWAVTKMVPNKPLALTSRDFISYKLILKRTPTDDYYVVILPTLVTVFMTLSIFWMPVWSLDRIKIIGSDLTVICLITMYICNRLPSFGSKPPLLVKFQAWHLYMLIIALLYSTCLRFIISANKLPVPYKITSILQGPIGKILVLRHPQALYDEDTHKIVKGEVNKDNIFPRGKSSNSWSDVALALDMMMFGMYFLTFTFLGLRFFF